MTAESSSRSASERSPAPARGTRPVLPPGRSWALIRRLLAGYLKPYAGRLALAVLCMALAAAAQPALAWLMEPVVRDIFINRDAAMLVIVPIAVLAVMVVGGLANFGQAVLMSWVGLRVVADLQRQTFRHVLDQDLAFFHNTATGTLIANLTSDANLVRQATSATMTGLVKDLLSVVLLVALMFYENWQLALVVLFVFPLAIWPIARIGRRMRKVVTNTQAEVGQFASLLNETFQGARHVKAYGMEDYETDRAATLIERLFKLYMKSARTRAISAPIMEALGGIAIALVILYGGYQVIRGSAEAGAFFAFITALLLAYRPLKSVANLNTVLQEGLAAAERVFRVLDLTPRITDRHGATPLVVSGGRITFENVHFAYHADAPALNGVDLTVPAGQSVALVGPSGAGKSTILNLIPRFYDATAGAVRIDGQDVRDVTGASLRRAIALVSQEITLFDDSIRNNIAYGRPGADSAAIEAAARGAAAHGFINALPDGYDTLVGERGVKLSGGERQRIAIARAMLKDAPILLLDEATASLDAESEAQVQAALAALMVGRTSLVIAHRLATVRGVDRIVVIDGGKVIEQGDHESLQAAGGLYAKLHALQFADQGGGGGRVASLAAGRP